LEDELPFPTEDTVFDYSLISQSKQGSRVHVSATLKRHLVQTLRTWQETSFNPDLITTEAWAYRALMNRVLTPEQQARPVLLIQMGFQKTGFYLHQNSLPEYIGESNWGGRDLTQELSKALGIPFNAAENRKRSTSLTTPPDSEAAKALTQSLENFILEIRQVELLTRKVTSEPISLIYLAGAASETLDLPAWLETRLGIPTRPLAPWTPTLTANSGKPLSPEILF
jgi:type IV pilus assembly protein PilM